MIIYGRVTSEEELNQILALQQKNLPWVVSSEEKKIEGIVTVCHTLDILRAMNELCPHIIAKSDGIVIGYALCMHPKFADAIEVLRPMFDEINVVHPKIKNYIVMGQICIAKAFRGQGVFRKLYQTMLENIQPEFGLIITEVDAENRRSLQAHYSVGFEEFKTYRSGDQNWKLIGLS
ncbi:Acetyltransferase (GNAT) family protein [Pricia antarctica]|uniref:Acetyltransferase (GNAT) family protein n=1 Tax=Pricia antarctica TaxID=641691 RepID=A0A1G6W544_9FLAO|nr:GNAT family N-acetyltransferase [Pricia antarctica]SDD60813.1 Acetyltransferase (GNAT) family protein [Pricia antarctica]